MQNCECGKLGTWMYIPDGWVVCDECIDKHRGCSCHHYGVEDLDTPPLEELNKTWKWIEENKVWCNVDDNGKEYPCIEFWYSEEGFEDEESGIDIMQTIFNTQTIFNGLIDG